MITRRKAIVCCAAGLLGLTFQAMPAGAERNNEPLAVVVANNSSLNDISFYRLKRLYLGDAMDAPGGKKLLPLNRGSTTSERVGFDQSVLGMSPEEVARYWIDRRIRGQSGAPKAVDPASVLQKVVARLPGAISYVRVSELSSQMKVVKIDSKSPGDVGYPIVSSSTFRDQVSMAPSSPQVTE
jgi:hypothetical protein